MEACYIFLYTSSNTQNNLSKTMNTLNKTALAIALAVGTAASSNAATIFASEGFESDTGSWSTGSRGGVSANNDSGLYNFNGGTGVNSPADATNFATTDQGAFRLENGFATLLSDVFDLSVGGTTESITISLDLKGYRTQTTRIAHIEYSNDNGASWLKIARFTGGTGTTTAAGFGSVTFTEGGGLSASGSLSTGGATYSGEAFGSQSSIRFIYDNTNDGRSQFIDNLEVTTTAPFVPVPEPSSTALLGLGGLALILRKRR
jgi:hypothetical protein